MKRNLKRVFTLMLALIMTLGVLPFEAAAVNTQGSGLTPVGSSTFSGNGTGTSRVDACTGWNVSVQRIPVLVQAGKVPDASEIDKALEDMNYLPDMDNLSKGARTLFIFRSNDVSLPLRMSGDLAYYTTGYAADAYDGQHVLFVDQNAVSGGEYKLTDMMMALYGEFAKGIDESGKFTADLSSLVLDAGGGTSAAKTILCSLFYMPDKGGPAGFKTHGRYPSLQVSSTEAYKRMFEPSGRFEAYNNAIRGEAASYKRWCGNDGNTSAMDFTVYMLLASCIARCTGDTSLEKEIAKNWCQAMRGQDYYNYAVAVSVCCSTLGSVKNTRAATLTAFDALRTYYNKKKGTDIPRQQPGDTYSPVEQLLRTHSVSGGTAGPAWGAGIQSSGTVTAFGYEVYGAGYTVNWWPSAAMIRNDGNKLAMLYTLYGCDKKGSGTATTITLSDGRTYNTELGYYYLFTPTPLPRSTATASFEFEATLASDLLSNSTVGVHILNEDVVTELGDVQVDVEAKWYVDWDPEHSRLQGNGKIVETKGRTIKDIVSDMITAERATLNIDTTMQDYVNMVSAAATDYGISVPNFSAIEALKSKATYKYQTGDIKIPFWCVMYSNVPMTGAEAGDTTNADRGYNGSGSVGSLSATYMYNDGVNLYGPGSGHPTSDFELYFRGHSRPDREGAAGQYTGLNEEVAQAMIADPNIGRFFEIDGNVLSLKAMPVTPGDPNSTSLTEFYDYMESVGWVMSCTTTVPGSMYVDVEEEQSTIIDAGIGCGFWVFNFGGLIEYTGNITLTYEEEVVEPPVYAYMYDENGEEVLDVNGNPIYTELSAGGTVSTVTKSIGFGISVPGYASRGSKTTYITDLKFDYLTAKGKSEEHPTYHSIVDPNPYSEFKQGTVSSTGTVTERFNSMTGTPTFTWVENNGELTGSKYADPSSYGHYFQRFAVGGSEFVVEFDGKYMHDQTATRTFTFNFDTSTCSLNGTGPAHAHSSHMLGGDPPTPCGDCHFNGDTSGDHQQCGSHSNTTSTLSFTYTYTGLCYVDIENLRVWQLNEGLLQGTYELLDTDEVWAEVMSVPTGASWNIAGENTAEAGRMVYEAFPYGATGKGAAGDRDNLVWNITGNHDCKNYAKDNMNDVKSILSGQMDGATMVSDFIVLHTSLGDMSVCYYEQDSKESKPIMVSIETTEPCNPNQHIDTPTDVATITLERTRDTVEFELTDYDSMYNTVWKGNGLTAEGSAFVPEGVTYGGYNGDYMNMSGKYKSHAQNATNMKGQWSSTTAYENKSKVFGARGALSGQAVGSASALYKSVPSSALRIMDDTLVIPDNKQNGDYNFRSSWVFYECLCWYEKQTGQYDGMYSKGESSLFHNKPGFEMMAGYGPGSPYTTVCNSIVVYDPVSNQNAIVVSLPEERDQRAEANTLPNNLPVTPCPGNSCEFSTLVDHSDVSHLHTAACFHIGTFESHTVNNVHEHVDARYWVDTGLGDGGGYWVEPCEKNSGVQCSASSPCMVTGRHNSSACTFGHSCNGCETCHVCTQNGGTGAGGASAGQYVSISTGQTVYITQGSGQYIYLHTSGCTYAGQYHASPYPNQCSCDHASCTPTPVATAQVYACNDMPLNKHVCVNAGDYICGNVPNTHVHDSTCSQSVTRGNISYNATGTDVYSFTATSAGTIRFYSTSYSNDPRGRIYINGNCVVDDDDSGGGYNFDTGTISYNAGDVVRCNVYQYGSSGAGTCNIKIELNGGGGSGCSNTPNTHVHNASCAKSTAGCYTKTTVTFACTDPHHTWDTDWHFYTTGRMHKSGTVCSGVGCSDTTDIQAFGNKYVPLSTLSTGSIVRHTDGTMHITTADDGGKCLMCNKSYVVWKAATSTTRVLSDIEIDQETGHYPMGDMRCWQPCGDSSKHSEVRDVIPDGNGSYLKQGNFINLDYGFDIYYPNTGDFYQTGKRASSQISEERGYGYNNNMDITEWVAHKWVIFPFDVVYNGTQYRKYTPIFLEVPQTLFHFYCVLENSEINAAEVTFGMTAINDRMNMSVDEAFRNESTNKRVQSYWRPHDVDKRFYIDVVGRIGALTMNDVGDFRYSNFFKQTLDSWLVPNVIRKVNTAKQNNLVIDDYDIRGILNTEARIVEGSSEDYALQGKQRVENQEYTNPTVLGNTWGVRGERLRNLWPLPLTPTYLKEAAEGNSLQRPGYFDTAGVWHETPNNQAALYLQPVRVGYDAYMDFSTAGNYYGQHRISDGDDCLVIPHYFKLDLDTNKIYPVDIYEMVAGNYVLINGAYPDKSITTPTNDNMVSLNWVEECARRNYDDVEQRKTELVHTSYGLDLPRGSKWTYGTWDYMRLFDRNRTSIGTTKTYGIETSDDVFVSSRYDLQGARWHFNLGLPSSAVFVYKGDTPTKANIDKCCDTDRAVIVCGLEIWARGDVWTLLYDGEHVNKPFKLANRTYDPDEWVHNPDPGQPTFVYPGREEPLVIAEIISINHSSKEDVTTSGTH